MSEQVKPYLGEDGKLYYNYCVGAEYIMASRSGVMFSYRILDCEYEDGKEYYRIESAGKELPTRFSVEELELLLSRMNVEQTEEGERRELPLLLEEVEQYFNDKRNELKNANAEANRVLKAAGYFKLVSACGVLRKNLLRAQADGRTDDIKALRKQIKENEDKRTKILTEKKIDIKVLTKAADCKVCCDTGTVSGHICECAYQIADKIKAYNAALRLAEREEI